MSTSIQYCSYWCVAYSIAPGAIPRNVFVDVICEVLAFPVCFLYEKGTFSKIKELSKKPNCKISLKKYFTQRLTNVDTRFATNMSILFYALYVTEKKQVDDAISIAVRKARRQDITAGQLKDPNNVRHFSKRPSFSIFTTDPRLAIILATCTN